MIISLRHIRKKVLVVLILVLCCSVVSGMYRSRLEKESRQAMGEYDEAVVEAFLTVLGNFVQGDNNIELFDISKGEVINHFEMTPQIRNIVVDYLDNVSGMYVKVNAFPDKGKILRVHIDPGAEIVNKWLNSYGIFIVENVFIIYPEAGTPYILLLDSSNRPLFFNFGADDKFELLNLLEIK